MSFRLHHSSAGSSAQVFCNTAQKSIWNENENKRAKDRRQ